MLSINQCCFQLYPDKKFPLFLHFFVVLTHNSLYLDHFKCMLLLMMIVTWTQIKMMMKTFPPSSHSWTRLLKQVRTESQKLRQGISKGKDTALWMKSLSISWKFVNYVDDGDDDDWGPACVDLLAQEVWNRWKTLLASISRNNSWIHIYFAVKKVTPS